MVIVPCRGLPGGDPSPRPVVELTVGAGEFIDVIALCDTGSLQNRFGAWVAGFAGLDLQDLEPEPIGLGGHHLVARTCLVPLTLGDFTWEAPVSFCDPWPWNYQLLGLEGFFRWFEATIRAADREIELTPITH